MQCFQSFILLLAWKMAIHPYISISRSMILLFQCSSWHTLAANPSKTKVKTKFLTAGYKFTWANFDSPASPNNQELQLFVLSFKKKKKKSRINKVLKCWRHNFSLNTDLSGEDWFVKSNTSSVHKSKLLWCMSSLSARRPLQLLGIYFGTKPDLAHFRNKNM